ncbi:MAG: penicillin-binding transpeptidase domain-containing protein [Lachnospiraceae bacterium]|nr:penicillin-binding transpeptidase domain-containing protein [Lachnospiraceae bacterium]
MLNDLLEIIQELFRKILSSRVFALVLIFTFMFLTLIVKLFHLQIVDGEQYLNEYVQMTEKTVTTPGTRGNIYDRNGNLLAYNELAYSVTIQDTGAYPNNASMNAMLLRLVRILEKHGYDIQGKLEVTLDQNGDMVYTCSSESARKRFLRDFYGRKSTEELDDAKGLYPSAITAREVVEQRQQRYELDAMKDELGNPVILTDWELLQIVNIRYTMSLVGYKKYVANTITAYVDEETVADIMEHTDELEGVNIEEATVRVYNDSIYFAPIIGYTGKVQDDQLEELRKTNPAYELSDIVGRTGIEASMESELQGQKGYRNLIVNNRGSVMEVVSETQPSTGNDIYLTVDRNLQIGIYHLIEQQLAGILVSQLVNTDVEISDTTDASKIQIPIKDAYYQLINNNVLSLTHMDQEDASDIEREINAQYKRSKAQILEQLRYELMSEHATVMKDLPKDMMAYMVYIYNYLSEPSIGIVKRDSIDVNSETYLAWKNDEISLRDYIYAGISDNWIDTTKLDVQTKYSSADDIYTVLVDYVLGELEHDGKFTKRIYRYLINDDVVTGRQLCLALYAQGVLPYDEQQIQLLTANGDNYAFTFMKEKIANIEITPAQLALDPCTGGVVITDVNTGEVRALVTYPSYDNNRLSGSADAAYLAQLQEDLSLPLYNNATQAKKAPGSTFKPITAIAGLEEKVIGLYDTIDDTGKYEEVSPPINCWIYPGHHGPLNVVGGIQNSCNYFFSEVAHRLSTDENGVYSTDRGLATIRKYATMFGLDRPSGIEISETTPEMTTEDPERSAMGQGTNSYANVQLSRYVAALANRGTVFELSLLDKMTDSTGTLIKDYTPEVSGHIEIETSTWDAVQQGMRNVISDGSAKKIFKDLEVEIAGKTGTAQESKTRANHAFFISYGPYTNPEICVSVNIPYGYSSSNAATVAKNIYRFYYGYTDLDYILNTGALSVSDVKIGD